MGKGYAVILTGYIGWGLFPLYWALLTHVPAIEVLLHRMLWSAPMLLLLVLLSARRRQQVATALASWRELKWLTLSSLVVSLNWGIYIWAVANQRVLEASMGYFLTPLLNVLAGVIVFKERLGRLDLVAIVLAAAGVGYYFFTTAAVPWVVLAVGISFAAYGLLRKQMATNAVPGLFVEIMLLLPITLGSILWLHYHGKAVFMNHAFETDVWLILAGPVTVLPLAFFTAGTRLLPMTTVGILFYVTPSLQFFCGVLLLGEAFDVNRMIAFIGIWIGLAIFSYRLLSAKNPVSGA
ncbi:MAG: EamA family transporter RarD [Gammaproteobacteria bacterium]|nr:EamA family transporter RarD [Gammaproteobacteria bacterium]